MQPVRVACVRYLNTSPLVEGLEFVQGLTLLPAVPARIADMVRGGEADIGLASVVDAAGGDLSLVPAGMIGCDGPTMTVRVFSKVPMSEVRELHADTESHTSVVLAGVVLRERYGRSPEVRSYDARPGVGDHGWPTTMLLIGDKVVTDAPPTSVYPHELDLGAAWREMTGLPFVYAMWVCRSGEAGSERIALAASLLDRQRRHNQTRLDWIIETRGPAASWPLDAARTYLRDRLRYEVGAREREAVAAFYARASAAGLLRVSPGAPHWAPGGADTAT